jgi:hypothetical protein
MEIYKGTHAIALSQLTRSEREQIILNILNDPRLDFENKNDTTPSKRARTSKVLLETKALHPDCQINKIAVDWACQGASQRYVLIAQLALMNSQSYEDAFSENQ